MRTFIGIEFSSELKQRLSELQRVLRSVPGKGRWKHPDNFHLTLKFLGETSPVKIKEVSAALGKLGSSGGFRLIPGTLGQFKGRDNIRVLWLGLGGDIDKLRTLQKNVDTAMERLGFEVENRPYTPHITLAQDLYMESGFELLKDTAASISFPELYVDRIHLFSSEQIGNKRIYTSIAKFDLK